MRGTVIQYPRANHQQHDSLDRRRMFLYHISIRDTSDIVYIIKLVFHNYFVYLYLF